MSETVGMIGLGTMGRPMARRLLDCGFSLVLHDRDETVLNLFSDLPGCRIAESPAELAKLCQRVITMLPTSDVVETVLFGTDGMAQALLPGSLVMESSTGSVSQLESQAERLNAMGVHMIDAPFGRSPREAARGKLVAMVGGTDAEHAMVADLLDALAEKTIIAGPLGYGLRLKLVNNYMAMINHVLTGEVLALGAAIGLGREQTVSLLSTTAAGRGQLLTNFPNKVLRGDISPDFPVSMGIKDLDMALQLFHDHGLEAGFGRLARQGFVAAAEAGHGGDDCTAMLKYFDSQMKKP